MSATHLRPTTRPVAAGIFRGSGPQTLLVGTRCTSCASLYFPQSLSCRNPQCQDKKIEQALFGQRGRLYSYTVQAYRPPPLFQMDDWAPYALGLVELPEGLRVMSMLTGCPAADLRIGMEMELTTEALYRDADGNAVLTYKYRPVSDSQNSP